MARKNSTGGGIVLIGLIVLAMVAKYWYLFVTVGIIALVIWGIAKLVKSWSTPDTPKNKLDSRSVTISTADRDTPTQQSAKCAYCNTTGLHSILRVTDKTIDFNCSACGKISSFSNLTSIKSPRIISLPQHQEIQHHNSQIGTTINFRGKRTTTEICFPGRPMDALWKDR